jgi:hypothetical protein
MSLLETLAGSMGPDVIQSLSQQIGGEPGQTQSAVQAALPVLVGALANNSAQPQGAMALAGALMGHDGGILGNLAQSVLSPGHAQDGAGILGHLLGGKQSSAADAIGSHSGLSASQSSTLMTLLAPVVMGALGKHVAQNGLDAGGLTSFLGGQKSVAQASHGSLLTSILDRDGDGSIVGEAAQLGMGLLNQFLKK